MTSAPPQYTTNVPVRALSTVCPEPKPSYSDAELLTMFAGGVGTDSLTPDARSGRILAGSVQAHVSALEAAGVLKSRPTKPVGATDRETDMRKLVDNDAELYNRLQEEYCFYEQRYKYALRRFLELATSRNPSDNSAAQTMLKHTKTLNLRLNSVLEVMNYLAATRVPVINDNKSDINKRNKDINDKMARLRANYAMLSKDNAVITTQKEMVRYTEEKNNYTANQIALWGALNVVALGVIFYVYRN